ncbi:PREDICTED: regulation of nuclear pre-mRNA domain-containing protein 2-like [Amphimedon queenslandica]|uniref:CID domain-containing protein n=1 Tax=Amphimedon queenslandica TaxID=400682 RepID=A0A1X7U312_AMPQE|nr:PREDICTED: regulation of nuclear pre-mRNA domain-containing protein 2-like [Amphimedon queenslandica]|eukprot:XP_003389152.1 PREDICTED: regulation of nuclear pre-mRNA domain-containing protein 2-like [Amphimedon queenslandica]
MSSFSKSALEEKLRRLTSSQESIETLSLWIIHHKANASVIAETWSETFYQTDPDRKILLFYLINDVLQNSRRKGVTVFSEIFSSRLKQATFLVRGLKIQTSVERIIHIWRERRVFEEEYLNELDEILESKNVAAQSEKIDFKISLLEDSLVELGKFEGEMKIKSSALSQLPIDVSSTSSLSQLKDKSAGAQFKQDFNNASVKLQEFTECTAIEVTERKNVIDLIKDCKTYHKQHKRELERLLKDYRQLQTHLETLNKKLTEKVEVLDKAQHTATSDPTSKTDITVVGDMEIDSDTEANDEPSPINETPQILPVPTPSFLPPTVTPSPHTPTVTPSPLPPNVTPSPLPPNITPSSLPPSSLPPSLPHTNLPFPPFHPFQAPPIHPHPLAPPHSIPPVSTVPYSPSMPKPYTPIAPLPPHFPLLSASPGQSLGATPTSFSSPAPTPQSAPPTTMTEDHTFNQPKTLPDSIFHDYSDSESESDKRYSPSVPLSPEGHQAAPASCPDPSEESVTLSSNNFQFYGSGNYSNDKKADQSNSSVAPVVPVNSLSDTINSVASLVSKNSSTSDNNSNKKPYIQPEDIKITPSLTSILGEIFPQLSKSLGEKRRRESPLPPDPSPNKLPKINTSTTTERGFEETQPLNNSFVNDYPYPESYHVPPNIPPQRFPPPQSFRPPHPHFGFRPPAPRGFPLPPNVAMPPDASYHGSGGEQDLQYPHNQFKPVNNGRKPSRQYY